MRVSNWNCNQFFAVENGYQVQCSALNLPTLSSIKDNTHVSPTNTAFQKNLQQVEKTPTDKKYQLKMKTELCKNYSLGIICPYGSKCSFAHGTEELKSRVLVPIKYKTVRCKQFHESGHCRFGKRCQFLHKEKSKRKAELPKTSYSQIFETEVSNQLQSKDLSIEKYLDQYWNMDRLKFSKLEVFSAIRGDISQKRL